MNRINWRSVVLGGLVAGVVWTVLGSLATAAFGHDFAALPHNRLAAPSGGFITLNVVLDLLEGLSIVWLHAAIRPRFGGGPRTALIAAVA